MPQLASPKEIGLRLYHLRIARGWSGPLVADKVEVTRAAYYGWECGQKGVSLEHALRLAELYRLPVETIFGNGPSAV